MSVIVDLQGFSGPKGQFVLKEVAILTHCMTLPVVYQFASPFPWNVLSFDLRQNSWKERNYLGLKWNLGTTPCDGIEDILHSLLGLMEVISVKGREKVEWLSGVARKKAEGGLYCVLPTL